MSDDRPLTQIQPFNEHRFDDCIAYLAAAHNHPLSIYEMMKLHVMIDVYHTIDRGRPAIGGAIYPFTNGPVVRSSKSRVEAWKRQYETTGAMPEGFKVIDEGEFLRLSPTRIPDADDFSGSELSAMDKAWHDVVEKLKGNGFDASQSYFHRDSFIGRAWKKARQCGRNLSWDDIIDEYDADNSEKARLKSLIRL